MHTRPFAVVVHLVVFTLVANAGGCVGNRILVSDSTLPGHCCVASACPKTFHKVFLVSSQGSQPGPGGSQFSDYILSHYEGRADFVYEPILSKWISPPTTHRLQAIADDIAAAIGNDQHHVDVWAFSLGANSMGVIDEMVKKKHVNDAYMHVILIDPMILDDWFGRRVIELHMALGVPIAKFLRESEGYIKHSRHYLNLSGGTVINCDLSWNPVLLVTKFFNADRHYCWSGKSELQRKVRAYIDIRLNEALRDCYDCRVRCNVPEKSGLTTVHRP